jgi:hypothetical protein
MRLLAEGIIIVAPVLAAEWEMDSREAPEERVRAS